MFTKPFKWIKKAEYDKCGKFDVESAYIKNKAFDWFKPFEEDDEYKIEKNEAND